MIHYFVRAHGQDSALRARAMVSALLDAGFSLRVFADSGAERTLSDLVSVEFRAAPGSPGYPGAPPLLPRVRQELASLRRCEPELVVVDGDFAAYVAARRADVPTITLRAAGAPGYDFNAFRARVFRNVQRVSAASRPTASLVVCVAGVTDDVGPDEIAARPDPVARRCLVDGRQPTVLLADTGLEDAPFSSTLLRDTLTARGEALAELQSCWQRPHGSLTRSAEVRTLTEVVQGVAAMIGPANAAFIDEAARAGVPLCVGYNRASAEERAHAELIATHRLGIAVPVERLCTETLLRFVELARAGAFSTLAVDEELPTLSSALVRCTRQVLTAAASVTHTASQHAT